MNPGTLYLIPATLEDVKDGATAERALADLPPATLAVLRRLEDFAVEDAKSARAYLKAAGSDKPLRELRITEIGHAPSAESLRTCMATLARGCDLGLVSESGCPAVADPGAQLVRLAHEAGHRVVPLVGPSSILLALMASGLDGQRFAFNGYLPAAPAERTRAIRDLEERSRRQRETQIAIETPYRNQALFEALVATLQGSTRLVVATDLTLAGESVQSRSVAAWRSLPAPFSGKRPAVFLFLAAERGTQAPR